MDATLIEDREASTDVPASWKNLKSKVDLTILIPTETYLTLKKTKGLIPDS